MHLVLNTVSRRRLCSTIVLLFVVTIAEPAETPLKMIRAAASFADPIDGRPTHNRIRRSARYDPRSRDFTERCTRLAEFSAEKACDVFNACCSQDNLVNKTIGDRCQVADPTNGCTLDLQRGTYTIQWSQCKAYDCIDNIATSATTTTVLLFLSVTQC
ncbi:hypothetical protein AAVH_14947 [Aphelenchoides avenae]|nr:hypothetical protein AAVH_14947 [Aphelenchus avenae]